MVKDRIRLRFWIETGLALLSGILTVVTVVHKDWIETVFGVDPDQHSGAAEWLIASMALAVALTSLALASREWRRRRVATA